MEWGPTMVGLAVVMAGWMVLAALLSLALRLPRPHPAVRPTPELRDKPPAVVDYLRHDLLSAPAAPAATLFDLAARAYVELSPATDLSTKRSPRTVRPAPQRWRGATRPDS